MGKHFSSETFNIYIGWISLKFAQAVQFTSHKRESANAAQTLFRPDKRPKDGDSVTLTTFICLNELFLSLFMDTIYSHLNVLIKLIRTLEIVPRLTQSGRWRNLIWLLCVLTLTLSCCFLRTRQLIALIARSFQLQLTFHSALASA